MALNDDLRSRILELLQKDSTDLEIAKQLDISPYSVRAVRAHITMGTYGQSKSENEEFIEAEEVRFGLEKDLQRAVRQNIEQLEPGLKIIDEGGERKTAAGFIDILCEDKQSELVVVELKSGEASDSVIAQVLGYIAALGEEENKKIRGIIVASSFSKRTMYAAKLLPDMKLVSYRFNFVFKELK